MTEKLNQYRTANTPLPTTMLRWHLYGAGLENMGKLGEPEVVSVPTHGADELLVRQDACGLCFSDTKVIGLGANHPRMTGRNLATDPVTLGHEVSCTVVGVGENLKSRFKVGQRFVIQADVFYQGKSMAYGYVISGGLAEYSVIPKAIIEGDEGCYLLPVRDETGYVESALTEPWACVVSAYAQEHRNGIKHGGKMLIVGQEDGATHDYIWDNLLQAVRKPSEIYLLGLGGYALQSLLEAADGLAIPVISVGHFQIDELKQEATQGNGFDDIIVLGQIDGQVLETIAKGLANHGILNMVGDFQFDDKISLDIGRIHYNWHYYLGTPDNDPANAYAETRTADLLNEGLCWIIGAGGPMGQMHVQRAVQHSKPPRLVLATDVDTVRLESVRERFSAMASNRGIQLIIINPKEMTQEDFDAELRRISDGHGFDDIVSMVPVAALCEHAADFLAPGGWFNIFAGVARGTMAKLDLNRIVNDRVRYLGSSGSSLADMRETLARVEADELSTNASLAAIGGMKAAKEGLQAVKEGWFSGKTLIFPLIPDLPLTTLQDLETHYPSVFAKLQEGKFWTQAAEDELLSSLLA